MSLVGAPVCGAAQRLKSARSCWLCLYRRAGEACLQVVIGLLAYFSESARDLFLRPEWGWRRLWPRDTF